MPEQIYDKASLRSRFVNNRSTMGNRRRRDAASAIAARLESTPELKSARTVCAYWSLGTEPDTQSFNDALTARGVRVLLPVLLPDGDLDWARYEGAGLRLRKGRMGLLEPEGRREGPDAVRAADAILVPALAVSAGGERLGRGGGSYDRALARVIAQTAQQGRVDGVDDTSDTPVRRPWVCALVYDDELDAPIPAETHDQPVDAACAPSRLVRFHR